MLNCERFLKEIFFLIDGLLVTNHTLISCSNRYEWKKVKEIVMNDRWFTIREVADDVVISIGSWHEIFSNFFYIKRVSAKFVPNCWIMNINSDEWKLLRSHSWSQRRCRIAETFYTEKKKYDSVASGQEWFMSKDENWK